MPEEYLESSEFYAPPLPDLNTVEIPELPQQPEQASRLANTFRGAWVAAEVLPFTNGPLRYGLVFGSTIAATGNTVLAASALGVSTALLEGGAVLASSSLLTSGTGTRTLNRLNTELDKPWLQRYLPSNKELSPPLQSVVGLYAGTSILLTLKQRENPDRTKQELRKYGLVATAALTAVCTVQGVAIAEGLTNITDPKTMTVSVLTLGGMFAWAKRIKNKAIREKQASDNMDTV